jgi:hypothetical protein
VTALISPTHAVHEGRSPLYAAARRTVWLLPIYTALLGISTITHQPSYTTDFPGYAAYITTTQFLASHIGASIFGAALGVIGIFSAVILMSEREHVGRAFVGAGLFTIGSFLMTAGFGTAAFAQPAIGRAYQRGMADIVGVNSDVYGPSLTVTLLSGVFVWLVGGILFGRTIAHTDTTMRLAGNLFVIGLPIFSPIGIALGLFQPIAALILTVAGVLIARRLPRIVEGTGARPSHAGGPASHALGPDAEVSR